MGFQGQAAALRAYLAAVVALALAVTGVAGVQVDLVGLAEWGAATGLFLALYVVSELFPIRPVGRTDAGEFTTSAAFGFAVLLSAPLPAAILALAVGSLLGELPVRHRKPWPRVVFNASQLVLAFAAGGLVLEVVGGTVLTGDLPVPLVLAIVPAGAAMYVVNVGLTGLAIAIDRGAPVGLVLRQDLMPFDLLTHFLLLGLAPALVIVWRHSPVLVLLLLIVVLATYRSTRAAITGRYESMHDPLTGLANRRLVDQRLAHLLANGPDGERFAVMLMDLDRFKAVNDVLGHQLGDQLLVEVAGRLRQVEGVDTVGRLGGDEFCFVVRGPHDERELDAIGRRLVDTVVGSPYTVHGVPLQIEASLGIAIHPDHGADATALLRRADSAMYAAKQDGSDVRVARVSDQATGPGRVSLISELEQALDGRELRLDYQPQIAIDGRAVVGIEALLRWDHPRHGEVAPATYVRLVEHTELSGLLTRHVLRRTLEDAAERAAHGIVLPVSVNVSARDLLDTRLPRDLAALLDEFAVPPERITLEITENALLIDPDRVRQVVTELAALGVGRSVDDFGTGYSSLVAVCDLPLTEIKIDRTFVGSMVTRPSATTIVRSIIDLAKGLDLRVVAEGVEDLDTLALLRRLGCDVAQGFLISRPLAADVVIAWLQEHQVSEDGRRRDAPALRAVRGQASA